MGRALWTGVAVSLLALGVGCAGSKSEQKADRVVEQTMTGNLAFVDSRSVMVSNPHAPSAPARLLSRGEGATVVKEGHEVAWDQLAEGDAVRVTYTEHTSGPSEVARVEILGASEPAPQPYPGEGANPGEPGPTPPEQTPSPALPGDEN